MITPLEYRQVPRGAYYVWFQPSREKSRWVSVERKRPWGVFKKSARYGSFAVVAMDWYATEAEARVAADRWSAPGLAPAGVVGLPHTPSAEK
jgi:hypothetical protein